MPHPAWKCLLAPMCDSQTWRAQMAAVLHYTAENMIESFLEPVLDLLAALIDFDRAALADGAPGALPACSQRCMPAQAASPCMVTSGPRLSVLGMTPV